MNISILANLRKDADGSILEAVKNEFKGKADLTVFYDCTQQEFYKNADVIIALGGDGTIIRIAKCAAPLGIPVCGINLGRIGFLAAAEVSEIKKAAERILSRSYKIENRMMLDVSLKTGNETKHLGYVLNEAAIVRGGYTKMINLTFEVNGVYLDKYRADGTVIATPTGSSAYSLSAGGPVAEPNMEMLLLTPICPYDLQTRGIILPPDIELAVSVSGKPGASAGVSLDGQRDIPLNRYDKVIIKKSGYYAQFISLGDRSFYSVLRKKLGRK